MLILTRQPHNNKQIFKAIAFCANDNIPVEKLTVVSGLRGYSKPMSLNSILPSRDSRTTPSSSLSIGGTYNGKFRPVFHGDHLILSRRRKNLQQKYSELFSKRTHRQFGRKASVFVLLSLLRMASKIKRNWRTS